MTKRDQLLATVQTRAPRPAGQVRAALYPLARTNGNGAGSKRFSASEKKIWPESIPFFPNSGTKAKTPPSPKSFVAAF
jgi:hypothetical protein